MPEVPVQTNVARVRHRRLFPPLHLFRVEIFLEHMSATPASSPHSPKIGWLCLTALGIVFGDIGTSPLYALRECFDGNASLVNHDSVLGVLSLIIWTITLMITIQYVGLVMRANQDGEGGILTLMYVAFSENGKKPSPLVTKVMLILGVFGATLLYGDGMITPAISVISAVEGVGVAAPALTPLIIPITCLILVGLFAIQRLGTAKVGVAFGPITLVWFITLSILGIFWIAKSPSILLAFNPWLGIRFLLTHGHESIVVLSGVFLTVTGGEALYADMGHLGRRPIALSWYVLVKPALLLNYLGQGALLLSDPEAIRNPLQIMAPEWGRIPLLLLATLATVIASQALISGVFSLTMQAIQLGYLPRIRISHTSSSERGQIYISKVNWLMMIGCLLLVVSFGSSEHLAAAYGIAVSVTMMITTMLLFFAATRTWGWTPLKAIAVIMVQMILNLVFVYANSLKFFHGGFVPILIGVGLFVMMVTWREGRRILGEKLSRQAIPLDEFLENVTQGRDIHRVRGTAVFLSGSSGQTPVALMHNLKHNKVLHERMIFLTIHSTPRPYVPASERMTVEPLGDNIWRVVGNYGFMEKPDVSELLKSSADKDVACDMMQTSFFLGRETIIPSRRNFAYWRSRLFSLMSRNAQSAVAYYNIPYRRVVEFGMQIEL